MVSPWSVHERQLSDMVFDGLGVVIGLWVAGMLGLKMPYWALF